MAKYGAGSPVKATRALNWGIQPGTIGIVREVLHVNSDGVQMYGVHFERTAPHAVDDVPETVLAAA